MPACASIAPSARSCTITGLVAGRSYQVNIVAHNNLDGTGFQVSTTAAPLGLPTAPVVTANAGSAQIELSWTAPDDDGGTPITGYTVSVNPPATSGCNDLDGTATSCTLTGLENAQAYTVSLTALNIAGTGRASPAQTLTPGVAASVLASDYLGDAGLVLVSQITGAVSDHLSAPADAARSGASFVKLGGRTLALADSAAIAALRPLDWSGYDSIAALLRRGPASFSLHHGGATPGTYSLWGRASINGFEGKVNNGLVAYRSDLFAGTLGVDYQLKHALAGLGVTYSSGDGELGDNTTELRLVSVHPYLRWNLNDATQLWGQLGLGRGNLQLANSAGAITQDQDFRLGFVAGGSASALGTLPDSNIKLAIKTGAQAVQIKADDRNADSDSWRLRTALHAQRDYAPASGGTLRPELELGVRYDGGDAENGLGLDIGAALHLADPQRGLTIEGRGRYLLAHRTSALRQWNFGGMLSFDPGTAGRGLAVTLAPTYGTSEADAKSIWKDRIEPDKQRQALHLTATLGYGTGVLNGRAVATPYGKYFLSGNGTLRLREGLQLELPADRLRFDIFIEHSAGTTQRSDDSLNFKMELDY